MRPRRAAEAFWRCEQAFERRTRDMTFFLPPLFSPHFFFISLSGDVGWMGGALGAGFRGIGVERAYRIMMGTVLGGAVFAGTLEVERNGRLMFCW